MAVAVATLSLSDWFRLDDALKRSDRLIDLPRGVELYQLIDGRWELIEANLGGD